MIMYIGANIYNAYRNAAANLQSGHRRFEVHS
jgi:hypothetical protein